jgi:hypothetical protein
MLRVPADCVARLLTDTSISPAFFNQARKHKDNRYENGELRSSSIAGVGTMGGYHTCVWCR